jgi:hypothetical protein
VTVARGHRHLWTYDEVLGYRYIAGLRARVEHEAGGYLVRTNAQGFRCSHDFVARPPDGVRRVLLFGDSFTAGTGVSDGRRYGDLLEKRLAGVEVYNLAIAGAGIDQQLLAHHAHAAALERHAAVVGVWTDTIQRVASRYSLVRDDVGRLWYRPKPYFELDGDDALVLRNVPVPRDPIAVGELSESERHHAPQVAERHAQIAAFESPDHRDWRLLRAVLRRMCVELRCPVVLLLLPPYRHVEGTADHRPAHDRLRELHQPPQVTVHDPLPDLAALPSAARRRLRFGTDYHPTPAYHRIVAESVAPAVARALDEAAARVMTPTVNARVSLENTVA